MIALLRGVNVGGITVKSAPLAATFTEQGFTGVRTVLASGNVAFDAPDGTTSAALAKLKHRIGSGGGVRLQRVDRARAAGADGAARRGVSVHPRG